VRGKGEERGKGAGHRCPGYSSGKRRGKFLGRGERGKEEKARGPFPTTPLRGKREGREEESLQSYPISLPRGDEEGWKKKKKGGEGKEEKGGTSRVAAITRAPLGL